MVSSRNISNFWHTPDYILKSIRPPDIIVTSQLNGTKCTQSKVLEEYTYKLGNMSIYTLQSNARKAPRTHYYYFTLPQTAHLLLLLHNGLTEPEGKVCSPTHTQCTQRNTKCFKKDFTPFIKCTVKPTNNLLSF